MSDVKINCDKKLLNSTDIDCHLLPCCIKFTGECKIENYFQPSIRETTKKQQLATFRGRPLIGKKIELPENFSTLIVERKSGKPEEIKAISTAENFTCWNWDKKPDNNDAIIEALQWLPIANSIHQPITETDIQQLNNN